MSSSTSSPSPQHRVREIDALRGIFALGVLIFHYLYRYDSYIAVRPDNPFGSGTLSLYHDYFGALPVFCFFIISGFVISMTLDRVASPLDFAVGRASRLYPAYWVAIATTTLFVLVLPVPLLERTPSDVAVNLTMIQKALGVVDVDGVYWSLYVELCFYIFVFIFHSARLWPYLQKIIVVWILAVIAYGFVDPQRNPIPTVVVDLLVLQYGHFFIAGITFYLASQRGGFAWTDFVLLGLCLVAALPRYPIGITVAIAVAFAIFYLIVVGRGGMLALRPLLFLGTISYTLYLIHQHIGYVIIKHLNFSFWLEIAIATVTALLLASAITFLVERPAQRYLRRLWRNYRSRQNRA